MPGGKGKSSGGKSSGGKTSAEGPKKQQSHSARAGLQVSRDIFGWNFYGNATLATARVSSTIGASNNPGDLSTRKKRAAGRAEPWINRRIAPSAKAR